MEADRLLRNLPATHVSALCLRGGGASDAEIASELDIEPEAVAPMLRLAIAKLERVLAAQDG